VGRPRKTTDVRCPVCAHVFRIQNTRSYVSLGRESDLCPKLPGRQSDGAKALRSEITMCPRCSFSSLEDFDDLDFAPELRYGIENLLEEDGLIKVFRRSDPPWLAFHSAEACGKERRLSARELGDLCLRASWVCRKEREHPFENTFQLRAVRHFMRSLEEDSLEGRELSVTTYLVGELNRRLGHHREALNWYVNAGKTLEENESLAWLERMIAEQSRLAEAEAA
jgi:uncharacterized protein